MNVFQSEDVVFVVLTSVVIFSGDESETILEEVANT